jgi:hypothetical protein
MPLLADDLDLERAWRRVDRKSRSDPIIRTVEYQAFAHNLSHALEAVKAELAEGYQPSRLKAIDLPKPTLTLRPCAVPELSDRIYFQALVDELACEVEPKLLDEASGVVFGYSLTRDAAAAEMFTAGGYTRFYEKVRSEFESGHRHILVTDVAAYYATVDHRILRSTLSGLGGRAELVDGVMDMLARWSEGTGRGLPQGLWTSDFLGARVYLDRVDKAMSRYGYRYVRYSDDIRVVADSETECRRALRDLTIELRRIQLFPQEAKTRLYSEEKADRYLNYLRERAEKLAAKGLAWALDLAPYGYDASDSLEEVEGERLLSSEPLLVALVQEELSKDEADAMLLRRCLGALRKIKSEAVIEQAMALLVPLPCLTDVIVGYLRLSKDWERVKGAVIGFLSGPYNIYPWQEMWLLEYIRRAPYEPADGATLTEQDLRVIDDIAFDRNRHWACRVAAIDVIGKQGDDDYRFRIRDLYNDEANLDIRHAILHASVHLRKADRNRFFQACEGEDRRTDRVLTYLRERAVGEQAQADASS